VHADTLDPREDTPRPTSKQPTHSQSVQQSDVSRGPLAHPDPLQGNARNELSGSIGTLARHTSQSPHQKLLQLHSVSMLPARLLERVLTHISGMCASAHCVCLTTGGRIRPTSW